MAFIADLMERKVNFVCRDLPGTTLFMLHVYAAVVEEERRMIAVRTKARLSRPRHGALNKGRRNSRRTIMLPPLHAPTN